MNLVDSFIEYALAQSDSLYVIEDHLKDNYILYKGANFTSTVTITHLDIYNIIELKIDNEDRNTNSFYLHFELKDLDRAIELLNEMLASFKERLNKKGANILLCCTSGITTSYFSSKLNETSTLLNAGYHFNAVSLNDFYQVAYEYDVLLLAPQIGHELHKMREVFKDKPVLLIPTKLFASYDAASVITMIKKERHRRWKLQEMEKLPLERQTLKNLENTLVICIRIESSKVHLYYRIYHLGSILFENNILKDKYSLYDLTDILDVVIVQYPNIKNVVIVTPGVIDNGKLTFKSAKLFDVDVVDMLTDKYNRKVVLINDANAMAYGYYANEIKYSDVCFYFHPVATRTSGIGYVINGKLHQGRNHISGEMQYVLPTLKIDNELKNSYLTPEGAIELISKYLIGVIAHVDPQVILIYCDFIQDVDSLRKEIEKVIQPRFIPDIIKLNHCKEFMFLGGLMYLVDEIGDSVEKYQKNK